MAESTNNVCDVNSYIYQHPPHPNVLLTGLQSLREQELLFDITIIVDNKSFKAHKTVLAACSDYFRAMFTEPMLESRQNEIKLNGVTAKGFQILLDYFYTSQIELTPSNVQDILSTASHIQVQTVVYACASFLLNQIDLENCVDITNIAENYSLTHLKNQVYMFMNNSFREFSNTKEFYRLSPYQLETLLVCDYPVNCSELFIFKRVLQWFFKKVKEDETLIRRVKPILQNINFNEISYSAFKSIIDPLMQSSYINKLLLTNIITECSRTTFINCNIPKILINSRGMQMALLKIGGFGMKGMTNEITYCLPNKQKWRHLTMIPHVEQCNFGTAVYKNELYIIGGCFNQLLQETIHPFGFKYNPYCGQWSTIATMRTERCRFSLNLFDGYLYAIGGSTEMENEDETSACEKYNPLTNTWENVPPLFEYRTQHAGAAYEEGDCKRLYISGGIDKEIVLSSVCYYSSPSDRWFFSEPMLTPRADHVMIPVGNEIYVCGGWTEDLETRTRTLVDTIDVYDVKCDQWRVLTKVPTPRYHAGIVRVENSIYFIGGFHNDAIFDRATAIIECFNISQNSWSTEKKYPQVVWEHACATLYIPKWRDDMEVLNF